MFERINRLTDWAVSRAVAHMQQPSNAAQYATELVRLRAKLEDERRAAGERIADLEARLKVSRGRASVLAADLRNSNRLAERLGRKVKTKNRILSERAGAAAMLEEQLALTEADRETAAGLMVKLALVEEERDSALKKAEFQTHVIASHESAMAGLHERIFSKSDTIGLLQMQLKDSLVAYGTLRPKREMPEGWSVDPSRDGLAAYRDGRYSVYITRAEALALAAYLDSEEPTQCP